MSHRNLPPPLSKLISTLYRRTYASAAPLEKQSSKPYRASTPKISSLVLLSLGVVTTFLAASSSAGATDYEWIGQVNGAGNTGVSLDTDNEFERFTVITGGSNSSLWSATTEAVILDGQSLTVSDNGYVRVENTTSSDILSNNGGIRLQGGSTIDFTGLEFVRLVSVGGNHNTNESVVITAADLFSRNTIDISADTVQIIGDIENRYWLGNNINITLDGTDSYWYGSEVLFGINLTLSNGATWIYDADNESGIGSEGQLTNLTLDGGIIVLDDQIVDATYRNTVIENDFDRFTLRDVTSTEAKHTAVTIDNLSGMGGTFLLDLDWTANQGAKEASADGTSDFITIGAVEGDGSVQNIVVSNPSSVHLEDMNHGDKLYFASVKDGETTFTSNLDGIENRADELYSFVYATQSEVDAEDGLTYWYIGKSLGGTNENASLLTSAARAAYSLASDLDRFNERRGQSRRGERGSNGPWVRYRFSSIGIDNAFDMDKHMIQVGYDADVSQTESRKIVGVAFDYTRGETDIDRIDATGDNDRYGLNLYYTVLADCGGYADFNAKIGRIGSDYDARNSSGENIGADFWQTYYGLSAEFGYKVDLTNRFFLEPQAQMQVLRIEGSNFTTEGGVKAEIDDANSLIGRLGLRAGYSFSFAESLPASSVYAVADVLREFKGDTVLRAIGRSTFYEYDESGRETWFDAGIGADLSVNRTMNLWLDTKYVFGGDFENTWSLNAGVRWMF